jgi:hypothetical protein
MNRRSATSIVFEGSTQCGTRVIAQAPLNLRQRHSGSTRQYVRGCIPNSKSTWWAAVNAKMQRSIVPPQQFELPIEVYSRLGFLGWVGLGSTAVLVPLCLIGGALVAITTATRPPQSIADVIMLLIGVVMTACGGCLLACIVTLVTDMFRLGPVLTITRGAIHDTRLTTQPVPWSAIDKASFVWQDPYTRLNPIAVRLELHGPIAARHNPFRFGAFLFRWRREPNELHVPLWMLSKHHIVLARIILEMVRRHGGKIG